MEDYTNSSICFVIDEYVHSERDRAILKRRLVDGILFEPLSEEFDMSVRHVKNIVYKHQQRIFAALKNHASPYTPLEGSPRPL